MMGSTADANPLGGSRDAAISVKVAAASIMALAPPLLWR